MVLFKHQPPRMVAGAVVLLMAMHLSWGLTLRLSQTAASLAKALRMRRVMVHRLQLWAPQRPPASRGSFRVQSALMRYRMLETSQSCVSGGASCNAFCTRSWRSPSSGRLRA